MRGLYQRKGSAKWQGRFRIPDELWKSREKLVAMGIEVQGTQQSDRSTGEDNQRLAEQRYQIMLNEFEATLEAWEDALVNGPSSLTTTEVHGLVKQSAVKTLAKTKPLLPDVDPSESSKLLETKHAQQALAAMPEPEQQSFHKEFSSYLSSSSEERHRTAFRWMREVSEGRGYPFLFADIMPIINRHFEQSSGEDASSLLNQNGLVADEGSRRSINFWLSATKGEVRATKSEAEGGDFRKLNELEAKITAIPDYNQPVQRTSALTFSDVITKEIERRKSGIGGRELSKDTIGRYHLARSEYSAHSRSNLVQDVTLQKASAWRDTMLIEKKYSNRTIHHRVGALKTLVSKSIKHAHSPPVFPNGNPIAELELPTYERPLARDLTYTLSEGEFILEASRKETKPDRRWLPWLVAYSGTRVNEPAKLRKNNFRTIEGVLCYDLQVNKDHGRTIKNDSSVRTIPLHSAIIAEGFLDYLDSIGDNDPLFPKSAATNVCRWIKDIWPDNKIKKRPNHAWRHLFKDLCDRYEVERWARLSIMGHAEGDVKYASDGYGGTDVKIPAVKKQLEKIEPYC